MTNATTRTVSRVVIADDDPIIRRALTIALEGAGLSVVAEATNGKEALELFKTEQPDVVCLDIEMPEMKGLEALAILRQQAPNAIVLLISAFATTQNVMQGVRLKVDGIVSKPFTRDKLIAEIDRAVAKRAR